MFEIRKTRSCMFWRFKNATQEKILKKNKKYEIFQGVTFCFSRLQNQDFHIFYFGIGSAYLELPIQVEVEFWLSVKMRPLGAPRPPATQISTWDSTVMQHSVVFWLVPFCANDHLLWHTGKEPTHTPTYFLKTGNSFPMLIFKNFKVVIKKWNSYPGMAQKIHIAKQVFFIFKVIDFCFIDRAWKTNKHGNSAKELKSSIIFFAILREEPIVYQEV